MTYTVKLCFLILDENNGGMHFRFLSVSEGMIGIPNLIIKLCWLCILVPEGVSVEVHGRYVSDSC